MIEQNIKLKLIVFLYQVEVKQAVNAQLSGHGLASCRYTQPLLRFIIFHHQHHHHQQPTIVYCWI